MAKTYCLDSGVFINGWHRHYRISSPIFQPVWEAFDENAQKGILFAPFEVWVEISKKDDELKEWFKDRRDYFFKQPTKDVIGVLKNVVLKQYERLAGEKAGRTGADAWVIAHAIVEGAVVVTEERQARTRGKNPRIPDVCEDLNVHYMDTGRLIDELGI